MKVKVQKSNYRRNIFFSDKYVIKKIIASDGIMFYEKMKKQIDSVQMKTTDHHLASGGPKNGPPLRKWWSKNGPPLSKLFFGIVTFEMHFITKFFQKLFFSEL